MRDIQKSILTRRWESHHRNLLLGGFALFDLGGRLLDTLLDTVAVPAFVSLFTRVGATPSTVGWVAGWAMFTMLVYGVVPAVFPDTLDGVVDQPPLKAATTATAIGMAIIFESGFFFISRMSGSPITGIGNEWFSAVAFAGAIAFVALVWRHHGGKPWSLRGPLAALVNGLDPFSDVHEDLHSSTWGRWMVVPAGVGAYLLICVSLSVVVFLLILLYPLPELAVFLYVGLAVLGNDDGHPVDVLGPQVDHRLAASVGAFNAGLKGIASMVFVLGGVGISGFFALIVSYGFLSQISSTVTLVIRLNLLVNRPYEVLFFILVTSTLGLLAVYGMWFWLRVVARLPYFLDTWAHTQPMDVQTDWTWEDKPSLLARPKGVMVPWAVVLITLNLVVSECGIRNVDCPSSPRFAIVLVSVVVGMLWLSRDSFSSEPQDPLWDNFAIPVALFVQIFAFGIAFDISGVWNVSLTTAHRIFVLLFVVVIVFYLPDGLTHLRSAGPSQYLIEGLIAFFAANVFLTGLLSGTNLGMYFGVVVAVGPILSFTYRYSQLTFLDELFPLPDR